MKSIKNIAGSVMAVWALMVFSFTMLVVLIPISIVGIWKEPKRTVLTHEIFQGWMKLFFVLTGVRRIYKGREHFRKGENYVVVCNHNSFMDVPLTSPGIPGANKTIAKVEMSRSSETFLMAASVKETCSAKA